MIISQSAIFRYGIALLFVGAALSLSLAFGNRFRTRF
jgi:hypothetical protein